MKLSNQGRARHPDGRLLRSRNRPPNVRMRIQVTVDGLLIRETFPPNRRRGNVVNRDRIGKEVSAMKRQELAPDPLTVIPFGSLDPITGWNGMERIITIRPYPGQHPIHLPLFVYPEQTPL